MSASNAIGSGAIVLTADAEGLTQGLNRSQTAVRDWGTKTASHATASAKKVSDALTKGMGGGSHGGGGALKSAFAAEIGSHVFGSLEGAASGAGGLIGGALAGPIGAAIGGAISAGVVKGLKASVGAAGDIASHFVEVLNDTARQGQMASALGLTSEQFTGVAGVAKSVGEDTREFLESLVTMGKLGFEAANGIGVVAPQAFQALGISAKEFISLRTDEQFFRMFEALNAIKDPLTKTRLLMNAFGEDGGKWLLPLLSKTPTQLREMARGFSVSTDEMKRATSASAEFKQAEAQIAMTIRQLAVGLAEPMGSVADSITSALKDSGPAIKELTAAGGDFLKNFLVPGAKLAGEFAKGFADTLAAIKEMKKLGGSGDDSSLNAAFRLLPVAARGAPSHLLLHSLDMIDGMTFGQTNYADEFLKAQKRMLDAREADRIADAIQKGANQLIESFKKIEEIPSIVNSGVEFLQSGMQFSKKYPTLFGEMLNTGFDGGMNRLFHSANPFRGEGPGAVWASVRGLANRIGAGGLFGLRDSLLGVGDKRLGDYGDRYAGAVTKGSREAYSAELSQLAGKRQQEAQEQGRKLDRLNNQMEQVVDFLKSLKGAVGII